MRLEWDETKRRSNVAKHGLDFFWAIAAFDGRPFLDLESHYLQDLRYLRVAILDGAYCTIIWTLRGEGLGRIISVRRSRSGEKREYRQLHGG